MVKLLDRVKVSVSGSPGTGDISLGVPPTGFQSFSTAGATDGALYPYVIEDGANWEYGHGTYHASGTVLSRTTILGSNNSGSAINVSSAAIVYVAILAEDVNAFNGTITLQGLADVDDSTPPGNGQVPVWSVTESKFVFATPAADGSSTLVSLSDVDDTTPPTNGQVPTWNSNEGKFKFATPSGGGNGGGGGAVTPPTVVQSAFNNGAAVTLTNAPTKGNLLIGFCTMHFYNGAASSPPTAASGWSQLASNAEPNSFANGVFYKIAGAGENAQQTFAAASASFVSVLYEIAGFDATNVANILCDYLGDQSPATDTTFSHSVANIPASSLVVGACFEQGDAGNVTVASSNTGVAVNSDQVGSTYSDTFFYYDTFNIVAPPSTLDLTVGYSSTGHHNGYGGQFTLYTLALPGSASSGGGEGGGGGGGTTPTYQSFASYVLVMHTNNGGPDLSIDYLIYYDNQGNPQNNSTATASATSQYGGAYGASNVLANDGQLWVSAAPAPADTSLTINYTSAFIPGSVEMNPRNTTEGPASCTLYGINASGSQIKIADLTFGTGANQTLTFTAPTKPAYAGPIVQKPTPGQFTDYSVVARGGSTSVNPVLKTDVSGALTMTVNTSGANGVHCAMRPLGGVANSFDFIAKIGQTIGSGTTYGINGLCMADANGNVQLWAMNGGGSGRVGAALDSYSSGGNWSDHNYDIGSSADGPWFRMTISADGTTIALFRSPDGLSWTLMETENLSNNGIGAITRYGFCVQNYNGSTYDILGIGEFYSTELTA